MTSDAEFVTSTPVKLLRGPSSWMWFAVEFATLVLFIAYALFYGWLSTETTWNDPSRHPLSSDVSSVLFALILAFFLLGGLMAVFRDGQERRVGYTTLPYSHDPYDLVDRHTGEVIRPAGVPPLKYSLTMSLKAERARAAQRAQAPAGSDA